MLGLGLGLGLNRHVRPAAAAGGGENPDLITNGGFDSGADWTLTSGASIGSGVLNLTSGGFATAVQVLAAGSQPAGNYTLTADSASPTGAVSADLVGAGDEFRGAAFISPGVGTEYPITASGEVSKIRIYGDEDGGALIDNLQLRAA